jgi:hypothetical protein
LTAQIAAQKAPQIGYVPWYQDNLRVRLDPLPFPFVLLLLVGFSLGVEVQLTGTLYLGEALLAMFALFGVFLNLGNTRFWTRDLYRFMIWLTVTYLAYIVTDITVQTPETNLLRGWARMGFQITDIFGLYVICRKNRYNLFPLFLGFAISAYFMPHSTLQGDFAVRWKFELAFSWVNSVCILASFIGRRRAAIYAVMSLLPVGMISIGLDSRMVGGVCIVVAVPLLSKMVASRRNRRLLLVVLVIAAIVGGSTTYYMLRVTSGGYGERREESNVARATAILTAVQHIGQHPFLGTGSWNVSEESLNRHRANTTTLGGKTVSIGMVLGHSQILQAAVEGGIFGSVFFVYFLVSLVNAAWWVVKRPLDRFSAFALFNLLMCIWHDLFSPLGGGQRIEIAVGVCICLLMKVEKNTWQRAVNSRGGC